MTDSSAPDSGDNTNGSSAIPQVSPTVALDAEVVDNPAERLTTEDLSKLPVASKFHLPAPTAPVKRRSVVSNGTVREDR